MTLGRWLRRLSKRLLGDTMVPIRGGPLAGKRWLVAAGSRFVKGTYEPEQSRLFQETIAKGHTVYDIGAHVGHYTVLASVLVGASGRVLAFEPLPLNLRYLKRHLSENGCSNVTIVESCVGASAGMARFSAGTGTGTGHLDREGAIEVDVVTLDEMIQSGAPEPQCLKIDVEGAELDVLSGATALLDRAHPALFLSLHGKEPRRSCVSFLEARGYRITPIDGKPVAETDEVLATV